MAKFISITFLIIFLLMLTDVISTQVHFSNLQTLRSHSKRHLDETTCSNFNSCEDCNEESSCLFMNSTCVTDPQNAIFDERYDSEADHDYCFNSQQSGNIRLPDEEGYQLLIKHDKSANSTFHSLCEWNIEIDKGAGVVIILDRDVNTYEDLVFRTYSENEGYLYFPLKGFVDCESERIRLVGENMRELTVRTKILNDASDYSMLISQSKSESNRTSTAVIAVLSVFIFIVSTCLLMILIICFLWIKTSIKRRRQIRQQRTHYFDRLRSKRQRIDDTMSKMRHGQFSEFNAEYDQTQCIVCLEDYSPEVEVHLTNECRHVFHSKCLFEWYQAINPIRDLHCPHCNTVNSCNSSPPSNHDENSQECEANNHAVHNLSSVDQLNVSFEGNVADMPQNHTGIVVSRNIIIY